MPSDILAYLRRADVPLNVLGLVLGAFLPIAALLKAADLPSSSSWEPWSPLFVLSLTAAVYMPLFGLYKYLDTRQAREEVWRRDVSVVCQQITWEIGKNCPTVSVGDLAVSFWRCLRDDEFDRTARFLLRGERRSSGVQWRKGRGVAGWLWAHPDEYGAVENLERRSEMSKEEFDRLSEEERLGLNYYEWRDVSRYTGVVAVREYARVGTTKEFVGVLVIDYVGKLERSDSAGDQLDQIERVVVRDDRVAELRGVLVERLKTRV